MASVEDPRRRQEHAARYQSLFREVNERIKDVNDRFHAFTSINDWVCECANNDCLERLEMSSQDYESVRSNGERFFVAPRPEHVWPDVERVVSRHERFWIVEMIERAAEVAKELDPRADGPLSLHT